MLAEDVYNQNKARIRRIAHEVMNPTTKYVPQEKVFDKEGNIEILFTGSKAVAPKMYEELNRITYMFRGVHVACRIIPEGIRDIRIICDEMDKKEAIELMECIEPIRKQVTDEISSFGIEMIDKLDTVTSRKERRKAQREVIESGVYIPLQEVVEFFYNYVNKNCKFPIKYKHSEIIVRGNKIEKVE